MVEEVTSFFDEVIVRTSEGKEGLERGRGEV